MSISKQAAVMLTCLFLILILPSRILSEEKILKKRPNTSEKTTTEKIIKAEPKFIWGRIYLRINFKLSLETYFLLKFMIAIENKKAQRKTFMPFTYFQKLISNYEQRIARPIRKTVVFVIPFNSHNFETVVP